MRLIEGKKGSPKMQEMIKNKEEEIRKLTKQYHELEELIRKHLNQWHVMIESERASNNEEWMLSDQVKYGLMEYELLPKNLRIRKDGN